MFLSFIKITLRKLYREKLYTIINVSGLALGIACFLILGLFLHNELTYDQHHKNHKRIYRIVEGWMNLKAVVSQPVLASLLMKVNPDIIDYVRFAIISGNLGELEFRSGDHTVLWKKVYAADDNVFEVFTYDIIYGDPKTALVDPGSIAISETFARTYFGDENPIGKIVSTNETTYKISLVFADLPANTHFKPDALISYNGPAYEANKSNLKSWDFTTCFTYLILPENYPQDSINKMFEDFYRKYSKEIGDLDKYKIDFLLQHLKEIHYGTEELMFDQQKGNALYLYGSVTIGLLIMLVACINYMNLATARSLKRGKEVGIQRVMGANRSQLIVQFIGESVVITLMALFLGMIIAELVLTLSPIKAMIGNLQLTDYVTKPVLLCLLLGSTVFTGIISGLYPAFYLSSISPMAAITVIKMAATSQFKLRQILVLIQFIISIGVIVCAFLMISQMRYIADIPLGFSKENRVAIELRGTDLIDKLNLIKIELFKNPNVLGVTSGFLEPGNYLLDPMATPVENNDGSIGSLPLHSLNIYDDDYLHVMGLKLLEGRGFSKDISTDEKEAVIVNETLVRKMGWNNPLSKKIQLENDTKMETRRVIGVVKDFHYQTMHSSIAPHVLVRMPNDFSHLNADYRILHVRTIIISISGKEIPLTIEHIKNVMEKIDPKHTFQYEFLDEIINRYYVTENRMIKLTGVFAGICVFICCLGLFGLSAFTTEQRSKEIGVRKVVGASTMQIILMLFKPTVVLVLIGAVIASASAYLVMERWLAGFAYKAGINPLIFVMATLIVIIVAFVTIALQSLKTAQANPVEALRYE